MVEMAVRVKQHHRFQSPGRQHLFKLLLFGTDIAAAINDDTLLPVAGNDVSVNLHGREYCPVYIHNVSLCRFRWQFPSAWVQKQNIRVL